MVHLEYKTYITDTDEKILEIEAGTKYAIESRSEPGIYRTITVTVNYKKELDYTCDCAGNYWRKPGYACHHIKMTLPVILQYYRNLNK